MKKYEYAEIKYQEKGILFSNTTEHRKLIDEYAKKGFQYIGFLPTEIDAKGSFRKIELIFQTPE